MTNISREITIRPYSESDKQAVIDLFVNVFDVPRNEKDWNWKYQGYFQEKSPLIFVAERQERNSRQIVGMYAAVRYSLCVSGKPVVAFQAVDISVLAEFRKQGIRKKLFAQFIQELDSRNALCLFGFSSIPHFQTGERAGDYFSLGEIVRFEYHISAPFPNQKPGSSAYRLKALDSLHNYAGELHILSTVIQNRFPICVMRDLPYLIHRYIEHPYHTFQCFGLLDEKDQLVAFAAVRFDKNVAILYELYCAEKYEIARNFIAQLQTNLISQGAQIIRTWLRGQQEMRDALIDSGFLFSETNLIIPTIAFPQSTKQEKNFLLTPEHWYLSYGDSDL